MKKISLICKCECHQGGWNGKTHHGYEVENCSCQMKKHKFKPKKIKTNEPIAGIMTICATCKKGMWEGHYKEWEKTFRDVQQHNENYPIKKLDEHIDSGYSITEKINEIVSWINQHEEHIN